MVLQHSNPNFLSGIILKGFLVWPELTRRLVVFTVSVWQNIMRRVPHYQPLRRGSSLQATKETFLTGCVRLFVDWRRCLPRGPGLQPWTAGQEWQRASQAGADQRGHKGPDLQVPPGNGIHCTGSLTPRGTAARFLITERRHESEVFG